MFRASLNFTQKNNSLKTQHLAIIIYFTTIFISCVNDKEYADKRKTTNLNSQVKSYFIHYQNLDKYKDMRDVRILYLSQLNTFTRKGLLKKIEYFNDNMDPEGYMIPVYENGKITEEINYSKEGKMISTDKFRYISDRIIEYETSNEYGNIISHGKTIKKGLFSKSTETYIRKNNHDIKFGVVEVRTTFSEYNKEGNIISAMIMFKYNNDEDYKYHSYEWYEYLEFDIWDNWTKRILYFGKGHDNPQHIEIRDIKYYW